MQTLTPEEKTRLEELEKKENRTEEETKQYEALKAKTSNDESV